MPRSASIRDKAGNCICVCLFHDEDFEELSDDAIESFLTKQN